MKNRKIYLHLTIAMLLGMSTMFISCSDNENLEDPVDLRYEVQDRYDIGAIDPDPIKFRVKSSKQWIVTSNNADWCEITPPDGEPNVAYDIEVNYKDNVHLDDRIDTLIIKSDYWIGEWVTVVQKGTAYLDVEGADALTFIEDGGDLSFAVKSNQDWTATIVEGGEWLTMNSGSSGSLDGEISLSVGANRGERRTTQIEIYDRHGVLARTVDVTQSGVTLDVMGSTNMRVFFDDTYISFDVESNAEWEIVNDSKDAWYSFSQMSYSGNGTVEVVLEKNPLTSVRTASFKLQTKAVEGTTPVVREIEIKQAYEPIPNHYEFDATEKPKWEFLGGNPDFNGDVVLKGGVRQMIYGVGVGTYSF